MIICKTREEARQVKYKKILEKSGTCFPVRENPRDLFEADAGNVLGPALNSFVLWVLKQAQEHKVETLYFLARDGYFMYQCARIYCRKLGIPVECRYLSCSRYSIRIPVFHLNMDEALDYICRGGIEVNLQKILNRAGLTEEEKQAVMGEAFPKENDLEEIPYARLGEIREKLRASKTFMECTYQNSEKAYPNLRQYLMQEGLLENKKAALVDSGWVGSMQKTLNLVLHHMGKKENLTGYYWGLYELPEKVRRKDYFCFYFSPEKGLREKVYFSNCLFETIFSAPHGMTMSYKKEEGLLVPVYAEIDQPRRTFMKKLEKELLTFTEETAEKIRSLSEIDTKVYGRTAKQLLKWFMGSPTQGEAELFGSLEFSDDVLDVQRQQVAEILDSRELRANHVWNKAMVMLGIRDDVMKESAWYEGSAARYGRWEEYHRTLYRIYKYLLYIRKKYYYNKIKETEND